MAESHNPSGKATVTDEKIVEALGEALEAAGEGVLAVPSADVADLLPIKRPAVKKRLDKLALEEGTGVRRFQASREWVYYPAENAENTALHAYTPPQAVAEPARHGWSAYLDRVTALILNLPSDSIVSARRRGVLGVDLGILVYFGFVFLVYGTAAAVLGTLLLDMDPVTTFAAFGFAAVMVRGAMLLGQAFGYGHFEVDE